MGVYRNSMLFAKGLIYESKSGYKTASKRFKESDLDINVSDKVFLITGANSGIGFQTAKTITEKGGEVHLVCRNEDRAKAAVERISKDTGSDNVHYHILDLSCIKDVIKFAKNFSKEHKQLDVLINNAGEMIQEFKKTDIENLEQSFATNVVGPFVLTVGLIPILKASKQRPRVVNVGSAGMLLQKLNANYFTKIAEKHYNGMLAYAQCKRQLAVLTEQWAVEHEDIQFSCMHPGWVDTPAARRGLGEFIEKMSQKFRSWEQGADTLIWLAISADALTHGNGMFFQDREVVRKHLPLAKTRETKTDREEFHQSIQNTLDSISI